MTRDFDWNADIIVVPCNTVGVAGKGMAKEARERFPEAFEKYKNECLSRRLVVGTVLPVHVPETDQTIVYLPTKEKWMYRSRRQWVEDGLKALVFFLQDPALREFTVAVPALGCGEGGLAWSVVEPLILEAFSRCPNQKLLLYPPQ